MENVIQINAIVQSDSSKGRVLSAIKKASDSSGVDFSYLVAKASQESGLDPSAKASTSSATGLYQFIDQTWLKTVKASGEKYGLGEAADKITISADGHARVDSAADRKAILALRNDPEIASQMAAELAKSNKASLERKVGGKVGSTELYLAHFLGAGGASSFLNAMKNNPNAKAADLLPQAAAANKNVFYDKATGRAKSVSEIYARFAQKFDDGNASVQFASASVPAAQEDKAAEKIHNKLATGITLASIGGSSSGSGLTLTNGITLSKEMQTPFATMMLAQMDMDIFGLDAMSSAYKLEKAANEENRRKSALSKLSGAA